MSQAPVAGSAPPTLNCLLLPLTDRTLLLPSVALAELINQRPVEPRPGMPDWYLGEIVWRGLRLPLLSFETASSGTLPAAPDSGARVAVINAIGGRPHLKFFALLVQGIPRPCKLDAALAAGATLVDVRTPAEHERESIPGAVNIPLDELRERHGEIGEGPVVVHCAVGQRGHSAARLLAQLGHDDVRNLDGGIRTWSTATR